ncbi:MAG: DUF3822 family protein [Bacteroidales bacterium]|nr:DUF3822 family protein [Bacteroidales bacterium]
MPYRVTLSNSAFDKAFEKEASQYYGLSIQLSLDGFSFCVLDPLQKKYIGIQSYHFQHMVSNGQLNTAINDLIPTVDLLGLPYESIKILWETHKSTLVPQPFFDAGNHADYLRMNHQIELGDVSLDDHLTILEARNVWLIPDIIRNSLKKYFPSAVIHHHGSVLIETLLTMNKNRDDGNGVFVYVRKTWFDIVVVSGNQLVFYNSFRYQAKEDFIYFLIYILEQLALNPETIKLVFLGEILKLSQIYDIANKYVRHVSFGNQTQDFRLSYVFDEIPEHFYFNLLNHYRCEL